MKTSIAIWLPLLVVAFGVFVFAAITLLRLRRVHRTLDDLSLFVRHVNLRELQMLLDPAEEASLRSKLSAREFRRIQRKRIMAALEQLWRVLHNTSLFLQYARVEYKASSSKNPAMFDDTDTLINSVIRTSIEVNKSTWRAIIKALFWVAMNVDSLSFLPSPSLSDLRQSLGLDILGAYAELVGLIGKLSLSNIDQHEKLMAAL